ncbi:hypothetical protein D8779_15255 [Pseudomonas leptonychotis]|uniref:Uncharacterized protein n=1 Tax=Pseudomonas leptonychotis TaxID=2448482 RepID=A0A4T1ZTA5_9PSED|nr:hypothetical protein D8779_15255 [Pseudomonas leptonychotis]
MGHCSKGQLCSQIVENYLRWQSCVKNGLGKPLAANALQRDPKGEWTEYCSFTARKLDSGILLRSTSWIHAVVRASAVFALSCLPRLRFSFAC